MRWDFSLRWRALGDPVSEGRRVWEWIQQIRPLHPSLDLWRPTAESREEAEQSPPITQDYLLRLTPLLSRHPTGQRSGMPHTGSGVSTH